MPACNKVKTQYLHYAWRVRVTVNDCDFLERLKPSSIMGYFQDIATEHAKHLDIGYAEMTAQNLSWIMSRMSFKVLYHPKIGDELTVVTYPQKPQTADVARDYYLYSADGQLIALGSARWCVVDKLTKRVQRCAHMFEGRGYNYINHKPYEGVSKRVETLGDSAALAYTYKAQLSDLDRNNHLNNTRYADLAFNACSKDFIAKHILRRFEINFLSEVFYDDILEVYKTISGTIIYVEARKNAMTAFRAEAEFYGSLA